MKILKYNLCTCVNYGTEEEPKIEEIMSPITIGWSEANEEIAKREAYNGEYTIEEDGIAESTEPTHESRITDLEEAMDLLLLGVTE